MKKIVVTREFVNVESPPVMQAMIGLFLEHVHIAGHDARGWPILSFEFACAPWLVDKLAAFHATCEDLEPEPAEESTPEVF